MFKELFDIYKKPSAEVLAQRELEDAKRELLSAQSHHEYFGNMVAYHQQRIRRLQAAQRLTAAGGN